MDPRDPRGDAEEEAVGHARQGGRRGSDGHPRHVLTRVRRPTYRETPKGRDVVSRWTSSLRLTRDCVVVGVCMVAFACPAVGWAAGGTPMPAPDDPPGVFATSSASKPSKASVPAPSHTAKRSSKPARAVPTPDAPCRRRMPPSSPPPRRRRSRRSPGPRRPRRHPTPRGRRARPRLRAPSRPPRRRPAPRAPCRSPSRSRSRLRHGGEAEAAARRRSRRRRTRVLPRHPGRATRFGSGSRPPSSRPATPTAVRAARCSSPPRFSWRLPREGAPSSASRRGARRGTRERVARALRRARRRGGMRGASRRGRRARPPVGELQRRRLRRLVQVERHGLVVVQLERARRDRAAAARRPCPRTRRARRSRARSTTAGRSSAAASRSGRTRRLRA